MDYARARLGLKRKDRRSRKMRALIDLPDGSREDRYIDSDDILGPVILPSFYEAGAVANKPFSRSFECLRDLKVIIVAPGRGKMLDYTRIGVELNCKPLTFGRMLAKIALGITVAYLGVDGFVPTVRNLILNNPDECGYWVGGFGGSAGESPQTTALHKVNIKGAAHLKSGDLIVVEIQLFAEYGGPNNYVVVGRAL